MQSHELLREVFQKCSAKQVAAEMDLSLSTIYKWAEPDDGAGSGTPNPLDRIEALLKCTADPRIVQWICQRASGYFVNNPKAKNHPPDVISGTNQIVQDFADRWPPSPPPRRTIRSPARRRMQFVPAGRS